MNNEQNKPIEAEELTDKELEGIVGDQSRGDLQIVEFGKIPGL